MGDWFLNLPILWMALAIFAAAYLIAGCSNRLFTGPIRRLQSGLAKLLPIAAPGRSMALMFCTLSSTSEVSEC
jgi:hypothetical protein